MDVIADTNNGTPNETAGVSLDNFKSFCIKQEVTDLDQTLESTRNVEFNLVNPEVKLEDDDNSFDLDDSNIQHEIFNGLSVPETQNCLPHTKRLDNSPKKYSCDQCNFQTVHKVSLYRHTRLHNPESIESYKCHFCNFETIYKRHFEVHLKVLHEGGKKTKLYKCDQCSYECNYRENLSRHKKTHLAPEERNSFVCDICGFETFYKKSYRVHMDLIHQVAKKEKEDEEYKCYHCPFETKYRVNIVRHLKTHMKGDTPVYKCEDCDFQTIHKTNYNTHVRRHKDPGKIKIFECQHCSHKTFYKASLRNHLKLHMKKDEIETYKCTICDFGTIYERSLKLHVLYMHNGAHRAIEYFKCHFCDFETRYRENWRRHEKGHMKPGKQDTYSCAECSFSTIQQGRYEKHILTHASAEQLAAVPQQTTTDKQLKKRRFRSVIDEPESGTFKAKNFSLGTMFQCCHCPFKTLTKNLLDAHLSQLHVEKKSDETRTTQKLFECEKCPFTTIHRSSIRRHRETHLRPGERKVFKCPTCDFSSFTRARVNSHECPNRSKNIVNLD